MSKVAIAIVTTLLIAIGMATLSADMPPIRITFYCESACPRPPLLRMVTGSTETGLERPTARAAAERLPAHHPAP